MKRQAPRGRIAGGSTQQFNECSGQDGRKAVYFVQGETSDVGLRDRLTGIDTNLDDLQSGVDAGSREADRIQNAAVSIEQLRLEPRAGAELVGSLVRHTRELQACVRDQRAALQELRATVAQLRVELTGPSAPLVRSRPVTAAARQRR
jgi:hypothetical protein